MSSSVHPDCPFCPENGRLSIIRKSPSGDTCFVQVLVRKAPKSAEMVPAKRAFFVLPMGHYRPDEDMPFDFMHEVNWHKHASGLVFDNGGFNYTESGGAQILDHAHYWLVRAKDGDPALGLYGLREYLRRIMTEGACFRACP